MSNYNVDYEILDYDKYYRRLSSICNNPSNKFNVQRLEPLGQTKCGFDIDHYKIGNGHIHIVYMGGCHGNEIIGVDYVTQLMGNIALGLGDYESFDPDLYTIEFIPCQNPEGFFTTTYALSSRMKNMSPEEIEKFSKQYYLAYRQDDVEAGLVNAIFRSFKEEINPSLDVDIQTEFATLYRNKDFGVKEIVAYLSLKNNSQEEQAIRDMVVSKWTEKKLDLNYVIPAVKHHQSMFSDLSFDCIPDIDEKHKKLKEAIMRLYENGKFPIGTLASFFSNASGVNLNDNNEPYYEELREQTMLHGEVFSKMRTSNLSKSIPGPIGTASKSLDEPFEYAEENIALLEYLEKNQDNNYVFMNCHGTGGLFYIYPIAEDDMEKAHNEGTERRFQFYINSRLATEYTKKTGEVYEEHTGKNEPYKGMGHPDRITGVGDVLRKKYLASFLLELSKMGGNPLAPYGDKNGNYYLTMTANFRANAKMMETLLELRHLYDMSYTMQYDGDRVRYGVRHK